jgi:hypothetical protein
MHLQLAFGDVVPVAANVPGHKEERAIVVT